MIIVVGIFIVVVVVDVVLVSGKFWLIINVWVKNIILVFIFVVGFSCFD